MALTIKTKEKQIGVFTVFPSGSLDANTSAKLKEKIDSLLESAARIMIFDLSDLDYISSAGIRVLLQTKKEMKQRNGKFVIMNPKPQVNKVFKIINALPSFTIFESVEELDKYLYRVQQSAVDGDQDSE